VALLTTDMDLTVSFYETVFEAVVTFTMEATDDHPCMKIIDLGSGGSLNVFEVPPEAMIGERRQIGGRGAIDHFAFATDSRQSLEAIATRMREAGAQEVGEIQVLGGAEYSLFFRGPDGMELEVCCPVEA
jgi:catechol 2,3-dioxygenase-like lactoylglutathione lyase family enzyme